MPRLLLCVCLFTVGCGPSEPDPNPKTGTPTGTPAVGTPGGTPTGTVATTPAIGALIGGVDPTTGVTDCNLDPEAWPDPVMAFGSVNWQLRSGGQVDAVIWQDLAAYLTPAENYWGGSLRSSLFAQDVPLVSYGYAVNADLELDANSPIPFADAMVEGGLRTGYYGFLVPFLFTLDGGGGGTWDSGYNPPTDLYDPVERLMIGVELGLDEAGVVTQVSSGATAIAPTLTLRIGEAAWSGDLALTDQYCTITYDLDGLQQQPL